MAELIQFDSVSGQRIANVVRIVEDLRPPARPLTYTPILSSEGRGGSAVRMATFTGSWTKNATKTVTLKYQTSTPNTYVAMNLFSNVGAAAATRNCAIAKDGTAWFLIAAEC